jgi:glycolate oxidase FAD binding subunit
MPRGRAAVSIVQERIRPTSTDSVSEILADSDRSGRKVSIVGGNTLAGMGFPAEGPDTTLETTGLTGVVANEPADLAIAVRAGTPLQSLSTVLAAQGQFLPFDAPQPHSATIGGTLAAGWLGPRRHLYGRIRDYLIGSAIVLADGTIARAGGMVPKNVAGYDMSRLYVGSFGTLGILVQANFKTVPRPPHARLFLAPLPENTRSRAMAQLRALAIPPAGAFWVDGFHKAIDGAAGDEGRIVVLLEGSNALLERATRDLRSALGRAGVPETTVTDAGARESFERVVDAYVACLGERSITYRVYPFADASEECTLRLHEVAQRFKLHAETIADVMNGDVVLRVSDRDARALAARIETFDDAVHEFEPRAQVVAGKNPQRDYLRVWGEAPAAIEQMRALKARFDPNRTLNPGRFVGGI